MQNTTVTYTEWLCSSVCPNLTILWSSIKTSPTLQNFPPPSLNRKAFLWEHLRPTRTPLLNTHYQLIAIPASCACMWVKQKLYEIIVSFNRCDKCWYFQLYPIFFNTHDTTLTSEDTNELWQFEDHWPRDGMEAMDSNQIRDLSLSPRCVDLNRSLCPSEPQILPNRNTTIFFT